MFEIGGGSTEDRIAHLIASSDDVGGRRATISGEEPAADMIWATTSAEFDVLLTMERGWKPSQFQAWLTDTWQRLLLD